MKTNSNGKRYYRAIIHLSTDQKMEFEEACKSLYTLGLLNLKFGVIFTVEAIEDVEE